MNLMDTNAKGNFARQKSILLYGTCLEKEHPEILKTFHVDSRLAFCPEREHINMAFYKLMAIMSVARSLAVITVDGSPHCVQLHYIADEILHYSSANYEVEHFIINKGKTVKISNNAVKISRYLYRIQKLLSNQL